jgi:hypothetical protein
LSNELLASEYGFIGVSFFVIAIARYLETDQPFIFICFNVLMSLLIFPIIWQTFEFRRQSTRRLLMQMEMNGTQSLEVTLSSIDSESRMRLMIKEGFFSGSKAVSSPVFVHFCVEKFGNSEWFVRYVVFLFAVVWGVEPNTYKFLLHILSVSEFEFSTKFLLFQFVFCFMQTADHSPMIDRHLLIYRKKLLEYLETQRTFWLTAVSGKESELDSNYNKLIEELTKVKSMICMMAKLFQFSPSVLCEKSIFESDILHRITKSTEAYSTATTILRRGPEYVCETLFEGFSQFVFGPSKPKTDFSESNCNSRFLSLRENCENAHRQASAVLPRDNWLMMYSRVFTVEKEEKRIFARKVVIWMLVVIVELLVLITLIIGLIVNGKIANEKRIEGELVEEYEKVVNTTIEFRDVVVNGQIDLGIMRHVETERFAEEHLQLYLQTKGILKEIPTKLTKLKSIFDEMSKHGINLPKEFSRDIVEFSELALSPNHGLSVSIEDIDFKMIKLYNHSSTILNSIHNYMKDTFISEFERSQNVCILTGICESGIGLIFGIIILILFNKMKTNVFDIINTTQSPIMKEIAHRFDRLLPDMRNETSSKKCNTPIYFVIFPVFFMFFILSVYPFFVVLMNREGPVIASLPVLPPAILFTEDQYFMMYAIAEMESDLISKGVLRTCTDGCYHQVPKFPIEIPNNPIFKYSPKFIANWDIPTSFFACFLSILFFWSCYRIHNLREGERLLESFPNLVIESNPILQSFESNEQLCSEEVREFVESVKSRPKVPDFLCLLEFDEEGNQIGIEGNALRLIGFIPLRIEEIEEMLSEYCEELRFFCETRQDGSSVNFKISDGRAISMTFGNEGRSLTIKDDTPNIEWNEKCKLMSEMNELIDRLHRLPRELERVILIGIESEKEIVELEKTEENLELLEERNGVKLLLMDATIPGACEQFLEMIEKYRNKCELLIGHIGGPLRIFETKIPVSKSRCVGQIHDDVRQLIRLIPRGRIVITKDFVIEMRRDISKITFETIEVSYDRQIEIMDL